MTKDHSSSRTSHQYQSREYAQNFDTAYKKLNQQQREAVDHIEGPVLVVAGPGTGKTQVLTMRIANILRLTDTKPSSILALTFTESAAQNMRLRLASLIGPDAYYVHISTFHAFCAQVIANHMEYFPLNPTSQPISELERFELLRSIVQDLPLDAVKPINSPLFHIRSLMSNIAAYKREGVSSDQLQTLIEQQWIDPETITARVQRQKITKRQQQLLEQVQVYAAYQERLRSAGRYDFEDMIALTVEVLSREEVLLQEYQEQYLYVLVDEYQDTNSVQNTVTKLLTKYWGEQANIFAVGDPHQSIYRFQGASLENITQFVSWYPQAAVFTLTTGYRCPQVIYTTAHHLIAKDTSLENLPSMGEAGQKLRKALESELQIDKTAPEPVRIVAASDATTALITMVEAIASLIKSGTPLDEIAVLYSKNRYALELIPYLEKWGIPYFVEGGLNALDQLIVTQFMQLCTVMVGLRQGDDISSQLFEICTYPWLKIDRTTLFQLGRLAGKTHRTLLEVLLLSDEALQEQTTEAIDSAAFEGIKSLLSQLEAWAALDFQVVFTSWLESVVTDSGLHEYLIKQADEALDPLLAIYSIVAFAKQMNQANQQFHLTDFLRALQTLTEQHVTIPLQSLAQSEQRIRLSSVHKAKGQEWSFVYVMHVVDGVWGNRRTPASLPVPEHIIETTSQLEPQSKEQQNQEDRRLLYVAMTRAKNRVEFWYEMLSDQDGVARAKVPSLFLSELDHQKQIVKIQAHLTETPAQLAATIIGPRPQGIEHDRLIAYLKHLTADFSLSVTALNNYVRDPERFLYQNLLTLPTAKLPHLAYGTAVHSALELMAKQAMSTDTTKNITAILARFDQQLARELITDSERARRTERGHDVLKAYQELEDLSKRKIWQTEAKIGYGSHAAFLNEIRLTGRIDRLDWIDESHKTVQVVDYKTGKHHTRNEILTETKTAQQELSERERALPPAIRGSLQRQLLFYRLLGELDRSFAPEITLGTFDFVETPFEQGKLIQHSFSLKPEDTKLLRELIVEVMQEIRELRFLDNLPDFSS